MVDFGDFLPLLRNNPTSLTQLKALLRYYVEDQGRLNVIPYFFIVTKWFLFGWHVPLWQTARFLQMWLIVTGVYVVLRQPRCRPFRRPMRCRTVCSRPSRHDGLGKTDSGRATRYSPASPGDTSGDRISAGRVAGACGLSALSCCFWQWHSRRRCCWWPCLSCSRWRAAAAQTDVSSRSEPVTAIVTWSVLPARCSRWQQWPSCGSHSMRKQMLYAGQYGKVALSGDHILAPLVLFLLPGYSTHRFCFPRILLIADEVFLAILAGGWWLAFRSAVDKSEMRRRLLIPLLLLLPGALAYVPWDAIQVEYGLPFLLSPAFLLGYATDFDRKLLQTPRRPRPSSHNPYPGIVRD